ncbi:transposase [Kitasatospora sp. NPDC017646]|uniref:transposase n=1 Tax=Kitasatospora sp. NPDC017646 TaxID=3364024 RepID=UPI00379E7946
MNRGLLILTPGVQLELNSGTWTVEEIEPHLGRVVLVAGDGERQRRPLRWLMNHPGLRALPSADAPSRSSSSRRSAVLSDLTDDQLKRARIRAEHVLEAETGYRGGHFSRTLPHEPRPAYDPATTTLSERRRAKSEELQGLVASEAEALGLRFMSERTLRRLSRYSGEDLVLACADGRWLRAGGGHPSITEEIREAIFAVREEFLRRSRMSMLARHRLMHQYVHEVFPEFPLEDVPGRTAFTAVWREWFGPDGSRQRYVRTAQVAEAGRRMVVHRPGQVVALDSTPLPVKVRESVFGEPVSVVLSLALDLYTHSIVAFRLTLVSDTSVDIAMLLRDVMMPLPMREGWDQDMEWPYPGVPATLVAEFAGHRVAALPFFAPETVTTDHGGPYRNHHIVAAERALGCSILPARTLRAHDKFAVERAFSSIKTLLLEHLLGFTGTDVADRGADPEADAVLTMIQMEHVIATWIVKIWQNRVLGEYAPSWGPGEKHSPNSLFAAAIQQSGLDLEIPDPKLYYKILPAHHVKIHQGRGVKILGLWYYDAVLGEDRFKGPSMRGGRHKGKWVVRSDRRDRRTVFFQDPDDPERWHPLRWTGLPPEGEVPAFSDANVQTLLGEVRRRRLAPRSDAELLPVLLDILGSAIPVSQWPSQMSKREKTSRSRRAAQAAQAAVDRPKQPRAEPATDTRPDTEATIVAWPLQASSVEEAVDADRRRRREAVVQDRQAPPPRLGEALRQRNLFLLPDDDQPEIELTGENV